MTDFKNKVILITGGANGIGKATAMEFLSRGGTVICWDINSEQGDKLLAATHNPLLKFMKVNVTDRDAVQKAMNTIIEEHRKIDVLINNAGITRDATLKKMTEEQWQQVLDVNLSGVFHCTQAAAQYMTEAGKGVILNAASVVGLYGNFGQTNYVATKSGVIGMTKVWARELGKKGVRVNAIAPGFIATEMVTTIPDKVISDLEDKTPLGCLGQPEDIAMAYAFLASDQAKFITGTTLSVDGGLVI